jgi:5-methylthioadenosine/S-adenosylhomocysteine deaminase
MALGTDGAKADHRLDMFDVMKFASLIHKGVQTDPSIFPAATVLAMATRYGARALGIAADALEPGRLADLVLVRLDRFHVQPAAPETIVTNLVHAARGPDVDLVRVDANIVVECGAVQTVDVPAVRARAAAFGRALLTSVG